MPPSDPTIVELEEDVSGSAYYSPDMAPIPVGKEPGEKKAAKPQAKKEKKRR